MIQLCIWILVKGFLSDRIASQLVILCYSLRKKSMLKTKAKNLSLKFVPYLFVAVTILTAFGSNSGTWVWMNLSLKVWIKFGLIVF